MSIYRPIRKGRVDKSATAFVVLFPHLIKPSFHGLIRFNTFFRLVPHNDSPIHPFSSPTRGILKCVNMTVQPVCISVCAPSCWRRLSFLRPPNHSRSGPARLARGQLVFGAGDERRILIRRALVLSPCPANERHVILRGPPRVGAARADRAPPRPRGVLPPPRPSLTGGTRSRGRCER